MKIMRVITSLLVITALVFAQGGRGKIRGVVTDQETGEVLVGANVSIEGTSLGASTDLNGVYVVLAIPTGTYRCKLATLVIRKLHFQTFASVRPRPRPKISSSRPQQLRWMRYKLLLSVRLFSEIPLTQSE